MKRRLKIRIVLATLFLVGAVFATNGARAWEPSCEDTNPNATYEPPQRKGIWKFVPYAYQTRDSDGRRVYVMCGYYPQPHS